jgi:hypothetical protein
MKGNTKKLSSHLKELVVVVLGITIAFALDNIADLRKAANEEKLYLEALNADLTKDIEQLQALLDSSNQILGLTGEVFNFIYTDAKADRYTRRHVTSTYTTPYFSNNNGTYLSLINSGDLKVITDFNLRQEIVSLYSIEYDRVLKTDQFVRELSTNRIYPYILKNITFHPREDRIMSAEPLKRNEAINLLGSYFNLMAGRNQDYQTLIDRCEAVKSLISSQL